MTDQTQTALSGLRRPKLLIRAARFGLAEYDRERSLGRVLRSPFAPAPGFAVSRLLETEAQLEAARRAGTAGYAPSRHVEVLIALMAEARLAPPEDRAA